MRRVMLVRAALVGLVVLGIASTSAAAEIKLFLPLGRTAYQTNERIDVSVIRSADVPLSAGDLTLTARGRTAAASPSHFR